MEFKLFTNSMYTRYRRREQHVSRVLLLCLLEQSYQDSNEGFLLELHVSLVFRFSSPSIPSSSTNTLLTGVLWSLQAERLMWEGSEVGTNIVIIWHLSACLCQPPFSQNKCPEWGNFLFKQICKGPSAKDALQEKRLTTFLYRGTGGGGGNVENSRFIWRVIQFWRIFMVQGK